MEGCAVMKVICASCGADIGETPSGNLGEGAVSHGLCEGCAWHFTAQMGMSLSRYLEGIGVPVVAVTPEGTIGIANSLACSILGKSAAEMQGYEPGKVFECEHSMLPEGCGHTVHCSGCEIRRSVTDTLLTGVPHRKVSAYLKQTTDPGFRCLELVISTERELGVVLLMIERMTEET
jgi:hypothetical protein